MEKSALFKHPAFKAVRMLLLVVVGFCVVFALVILAIQRQLVFPGTTSLRATPGSDPDEVERLEFTTSQGNQVAYYRAPADSSIATPDPLWVCFNGNASAALDWLDFLHRYPDERAGFLFIEYPGYLESEGSPSPRNIREASHEAVSALARELDIERADLTEDMAVLGFSIGSGTALEFAAHHPVHTVVIVAPFTRLLDMAKRTVPWPFYHLLLHRFDNVARLEELQARQSTPRITIIHGENDNIIPVKMGRTLKEKFPETEYLEILNGDHNGVLYSAQEQIWDAMMGNDGASDPDG